jgi:SAM-dependent methyltransferase
VARDAPFSMSAIVRIALLCLALAAHGAQAQQTLDVPFVGTPPVVVDAMLALGQVGADDYVIDLGCGDGRLVIAAARQRGARGYGVDLDSALIHAARQAAERAGMQGRVAFDVKNLYVTDIARASVLTLYLFPRVNLDLRPRLFRELKPGTRVVSHEFDFGNWRPDAQVTVDVPDKPYGPPRSTVYLWIVPADASGRWVWRLPGRGEASYEATCDQTFQELRATQGAGGHRIVGARLRGDEITFTLESGGAVERYRGRIDGDRISGTVATREGEYSWAASRVARGRMNIEAEQARPAISNLRRMGDRPYAHVSPFPPLGKGRG